MNDHEAYIALNMMRDMGPVRAKALAEALGSLPAIFTASATDLQSASGIGAELAGKIVAQREQVDPADQERRAQALGMEILTPDLPGYPDALRTIHDPPLALYVLGKIEKRDQHSIALVGTRHASHYGLSVADRLAYRLGQAGFTVISGLARGIDTAAHRGALKSAGRTLAVLGGGLDKLYPPENQELADEIVKRGAVISEFPLGREPDRTTFAIRNRIVSGLSLGVVVVEADRHSGALLTTKAAAEQGRSVMAVPGRIDSEKARGCHRLLKDGAKLVEDVDDILEEFEYLIQVGRKGAAPEMGIAAERPVVQLTPDEQAVAQALCAGALDVDALARAAKLPMASLNALLLGLEMKRVVRMLPGRLVELNQH